MVPRRHYVTYMTTTRLVLALVRPTIIHIILASLVLVPISFVLIVLLSVLVVFTFIIIPTFLKSLTSKRKVVLLLEDVPHIPNTFEVCISSHPIWLT